MYLGNPYQIEAFPKSFENLDTIFHVYGDVYTNNFKVHKE